MSKKRSRLEIIKDILVVIKERDGKIKPTHILYKSNLSHQMMEEYLGELIEKEFIKVHKKVRNSKTYSITDKGLKYIAKHREIMEFTERFGLN